MAKQRRQPLLLVITTAVAAINYRKHCSKAGKKKIESTMRKGFLHESTKKFNKIDQGQQFDMTSINFPKAIEKDFSLFLQLLLYYTTNNSKQMLQRS